MRGRAGRSKPSKWPANRSTTRACSMCPATAIVILRRRVLLVQVAQDRVAIEALHDVPAAEDGPAKRVPGPEALREEIVDQIVRGVLDHLDLLEDDRLLLLDILRGEARVPQDVGQEVDGERQVLVEHAHVEAGLLLGRERIHLSAHRIDRPGDVLRRPGLRALEDEMLDQMRDSAAALRLHARAGVDPDTDRHRTDMRHHLRDDADAVRQHVLSMRHRRSLAAGPLSSPRPRARSRASRARPWRAGRAAPPCGTAGSCRCRRSRAP